MKDRIYIALALVMSAAPAFAQATAPVSLPEPATMTLVGAGIAGAYIVRKFRKK